MRRAWFLIAPVALAAAACGRDDVPVAPSSPLTASESRAVAAGLVGLSGGYAASTATISARPFSLSYTSTLPCPLGGTLEPDIKLTGDFDRDTRSATVDLTGSEVANGCAYNANSQKVTVSGSFDLAGHAAITGAQPAGVQTFSVKGTFDWARADGSSGNCSLDLTASADYAGKTGTITGTACGQPVSFSGQLR